MFNAAGEEICSNIHRITEGDGDDWVKHLQPKIMFKFSESGQYVMQVRDLTSRRADSEFSYRVLIRPQMPHLGGFLVSSDQGAVNLVRGMTRELTITAEQQEGYNTRIAIRMKDLMPGVEMLPVTTEITAQDSRKNLAARGDLHRDWFFPSRITTKVILVARADAELTKVPRWVTVVAQPVIEGKVAKAIAGQRILMMVVDKT